MNELMLIPGVGKQISEDLQEIGLYEVRDLRNKDPQKLYDNLCKKQGGRLDRCVLYVMKCAVYFASNKNHDPELLKWWNWKDK